MFLFSGIKESSFWLKFDYLIERIQPCGVMAI